MNKTNLDQLLFSLTENEKKYKAYHSTSSPRYAATKKISISEQEVMYFQLDNLNSNKFILRKDSRYIELPFYTYSNINMNYIYSGECHYWIDNKELTLHKGDVCIFDKGVIRAKNVPETRISSLISTLVTSPISNTLQSHIHVSSLFYYN